ncbi:uncharacterized protein N7473_010319 [Penicillium subrubescens]|uniref:uncharacterized protein n=1 Tax=Penicillium subrubescens TaxID=1316194 RepID=UPI002545AF57|nr:uncharacterized protein N7473_010319 [Penicillium subrubescens]KAJ5883433.1 hypothetical protein N7473_010319 [Penicillium subrubescens]
MVWGDCLGFRASCQWFAKELVIIYIVQDKNPFSNISILQPIPEELKYISLMVLAPGNLRAVDKVAETFLAARRSTGMNPEDPGVGRLLSDPMAVFDDKPSFPAVKLALDEQPFGP